MQGSYAFVNNCLAMRRKNCFLPHFPKWHIGQTGRHIHYHSVT